MKNIAFFIAFSVTCFTATSQSLYPYKQGDLWGYIDTTGAPVIAPAYELAGFFYEGLAYAQIGDALGFIDEKGNEVIKAKYQAAFNFNEGYASVLLDEDWGVINNKGEMVIEPRFSGPMMFYNGLAKFKLERGLFSTYGFVNTKGDTIIYPSFEKASNFSDGLCMASKDGQNYGYINTKGEWVIQPTMPLESAIKINGEYDYSDKDFSNGHIAVMQERKFGLMDKTGKLVLACTFDFIGQFAEGLAPARKDTLYGYIDLKGNWIVKPAYSSAEAFHHGLAAVSLGDYSDRKYGFINREGKVVIPLTIYGNYNPYKSMEFFNGVVPCYIEKDVFGYINRAGKAIWRLE